MSNQKGTSGNRGSKWLTLFATVVIASSFAFIGVFFYARHQALQSSPLPRQQNPQESPEVATALRKERLAKATELRENWRSWAMSHKIELKQLVEDRSNNQNTLKAVWDVIPAAVTEKQGGISPRYLSSGIARFTWEPITKIQKPKSNSAADIAERQKEQQKDLADLRQDFVEQHDIALSISQRVGPHGVFFWASGRVTESEVVRNPALDTLPSNQRAPSFVTKHTEVLPPYDFLK